MTQPKLLTPAEAFRALADGKKLMKHACSYKYVFIDGAGVLSNQDGEIVVFDVFSGFTEYTEPAPKVVWVEYLITPVTPDSTNKGYTTWLHEEPLKLFQSTITKTGRKIEV